MPKIDLGNTILWNVGDTCIVFFTTGFHVIIIAYFPFLNHVFSGFQGLCIFLHFYEFFAQQPFHFAIILWRQCTNGLLRYRLPYNNYRPFSLFWIRIYGIFRITEDVFVLGVKVIYRGLLFIPLFADALRIGERPWNESTIS